MTKDEKVDGFKMTEEQSKRRHREMFPPTFQAENVDRTSNPLVQRLRTESSEQEEDYVALCDEAADEIERLQLERDDVYRIGTENCDRAIAAEAKRDRLRAALERINQDEFGVEYQKDQEDWQNDYWRVVNIARNALGPAHETSETLEEAVNRCDMDQIIRICDDYMLPCDVKVNHAIIRRGCTAGTVLRSIRNNAEGQRAFAGPVSPVETTAKQEPKDGCRFNGGPYCQQGTYPNCWCVDGR